MFLSEDHETGPHTRATGRPRDRTPAFPGPLALTENLELPTHPDPYIAQNQENLEIPFLLREKLPFPSLTLDKLELGHHCGSRPVSFMSFPKGSFALLHLSMVAELA